METCVPRAKQARWPCGRDARRRAKAQLVAERSLDATDRVVAELIEAEIRRQSETICLIPLENYESRAVLTAIGSVFTNKYSEGTLCEARVVPDP
jgi:hypothetical protein